MTLDKERVRAIITEEGGPTSHTAILAKSLGIPAVVTRRGATAIPEGETVLVDGMEGTVVVGPDEAKVKEALDAEQRKLALLQSVSGPGRTSDGHAGAAAGQHRRRQGPGAGGRGRLPRASGCSGPAPFPDRLNAPTLEEQQSVYQRSSTPSPGASGRADTGRRRRQAAGVRHRARRAEPASGARAADLAAASRAARGAAYGGGPGGAEQRSRGG